ncbi:type II toxin-antitoxin system ParD family antitoxin [Polymorphobacter sp. PAMC 29334]|uniref:type II toxin-antitoxin system ParD family antitoxin n=1 Tax=Polymorphobacter sp. PAMC 29334 TaxID=2862331 RepID=UPI001C756F19|nr:type II toxin-antitoxin system ParD family antitoxin [Polymorphobacter sp. PAMC 29334]QYE34822.1 type II toxin-antitoxin system ParD family antitoxin [Polymorphobacter sp. PAMC 29334]
MPTRNVSLTDFHDRFVGEIVAKGRFQNASEVVREGLRLLEKRELEEAAKLARFEMLVAEGDAAYARGEYEEVATEDLASWLAGLGRTGRGKTA